MMVPKGGTVFNMILQVSESVEQAVFAYENIMEFAAGYKFSFVEMATVFVNLKNAKMDYSYDNVKRLADKAVLNDIGLVQVSLQYMFSEKLRGKS